MKLLCHGAAFGFSGLDVLAEQQFKPLAGKRIGLITNHTGIDREGRRNIDVMRQAGVDIAAIFSPEHGFLGVDMQDARKHAVRTAVWAILLA